MPGTEKVFEYYRTAGFADSDLQATSEGYGEYLRWLPDNRSAAILDLGCGGGEFLAFLADRGFSAAEGIDFSEEQVVRCHQRGLARVERVLETDQFLASREERYACIVLNDVLEHVPKVDCIALLERLRAALAPGGTLLVKVPNAANVFGLVARYLDFTHEIAFTESSLRQVLVTAGFRSVEVSALPVRLRLRPKRIVYWTMNRLYLVAHRLAYVAAVGADAPKILSKLIVARASK